MVNQDAAVAQTAAVDERLVRDIVALDLLTLREHTQQAGDAMDATQQAHQVRAALQTHQLCAVRRADALVAYAMLRPANVDTWFVSGFCLAPEHRNATVLRELLTQVVTVLQTSGARELRSHVYKTNRASLAFHTRLGFTKGQENAKAVEFVATLESLAQHAVLRDVGAKLNKNAVLC
jgi:ribosomal protein S18 acetylase RimI-like enzyme